MLVVPPTASRRAIALAVAGLGGERATGWQLASLLGGERAG
jgi:hypothetical protein